MMYDSASSDPSDDDDHSLPPLKPGYYQWGQCGHFTVWRRLALANEAMWEARPRNSRDLFLYASLTFNSPILRSKLSSATESAWQHLFYDVPELTLSSSRACLPDLHLMYTTTRGLKDVENWVERTAFLEFGEERQEFDALRQKLLQRKQSNNRDNVFLYSHAQVEVKNLVSARNFQLMICVDHLITDGIGARILLGRYLSLLASSISEASQVNLEWRNNQDKLSPPWICIMNQDQDVSGTNYETIVSWYQDLLTNQMVF
jgi:15-O-acetyltransferase Tri3